MFGHWGLSKALIATFVTLGALSTGPTAFAQTSERLARPVAPSTVDEQGRLVVSRNATLGNLIVSQYGTYGNRISTSQHRDAVTEALRPMMCDREGGGGYVRDELERRIAAMDASMRAALKTRDAASLTDLSIAIAATFDHADPDAIRADEAIGPGAYHDAIIGFSIALDVCNFFGLERRL